MKKNKDINIKSVWNRWKETSDFLKMLLGISSLLIILGLAIVIIKKRNEESKTNPKENFITSEELRLKQKQVDPKLTDDLLNQVKTLSNRLATLESQSKVIVQPADVSHKLIGIDLLNTVLEGSIPLESFKKFLQKNPEPWAQTILATIGSIKECKTYSQLEDVLVQLPVQTVPMWGNVKSIIKYFFNIRRIDENGNYKMGKLEEVRNAIHAHDVTKALVIFEKLSPEIRTQYSSWKEMAIARFNLETIYKNLLNELVES